MYIIVPNTKPNKITSICEIVDNAIDIEPIVNNTIAKYTIKLYIIPIINTP